MALSRRRFWRESGEKPCAITQCVTAQGGFAVRTGVRIGDGYGAVVVAAEKTPHSTVGRPTESDFPLQLKRGEYLWCLAIGSAWLRRFPRIHR